MNFVYLTTNLVNERQYVGSHNGEETDNYFGSGNIIENALKKYGKENFSKEILEITETREEAFLLEEKYIRLNETHVSQGGYNISWSGGMGSWGGIHSEETKKKISKANKGKITWMKGKFHTKETKEKLSELHKGKNLCISHKEKIKKGLEKYKKSDKFKGLSEKDLKQRKVGQYNNYYGNTHKNEENYKEKYSTRKGITPTNALKVINTESGEIFNSLTAAAKFFDNPESARRAISNVCKGKIESYNGIKFKFI